MKVSLKILLPVLILVMLLITGSVLIFGLRIRLAESTAVLIILIVSSLILYFILKRIVLDPLESVFNAMSKVRSGNLDVKIETKAKNEIGEFAKIFNDTLKNIKESRDSLQEAKDVLEIKVRARTRELREQADNLDAQVKARTQELQGKIEELERFNKLAVDRELRMVELKEEIKSLKTKLESRNDQR